ncbi:acyl-CoA dehydrogenase family protein [candidate division KSB1 bacterium]
MSESSKKIGFIQSMFNGVIEKDLLKPFPNYQGDELEEMKVVLDMVKKFTKEQIDPITIDREHKIPDSVKEGMKELGLWGFIIPEEYGGFEQPEFTYNKTMELLTGRCGATAVMFGGHLSIGLKAILLFGTDEQKRKWFPELAAGDKIAAFALTEPDAGSDAAGIKTTADISDDGKYYILNGRKQWITNGGFADVFTVFAKVRNKESKTEDSKITAFIVTRDMDGFSSGKEEDKLGICGSSTTPLYLENVKVPAENILGNIGGGFNVAMGVLDTGRLGLGAGCVGASKSLLPYALDFALQREQFRKKIAEFDMIKEKFARILVSTFTAESMVYFSTTLKCNPMVTASVESAACKIFGSESFVQTSNDCLQIAGGNGFMREYPFERYMRDARINMIFEGTNEILRMFISTTGLMPYSVKLKKYYKTLPEDPNSRKQKIDELYNELAPSTDSCRIEGFSEKLKDQTELAERLTRKLNEAVIKSVLDQGRGIRDNQILQKRLAEAAMDIFGIIANVARVENLIQRDYSSTDKTILISNVFAMQAERRVDQNLDDVLNNRDEKIEELAQIVYDAEKFPFDILDY